MDLYDDTIIIFTSDYGEMLGDYETLYKTDYPFYSLIHIPFILKPAKGIKTLKIYTKPVSNADILPTLFSLLKMEKPRSVQGINIFHDRKENMPMSTCCNLLCKNRSLSLYDDRYRYTYIIQHLPEFAMDKTIFYLYNIIRTQRKEYRNAQSQNAVGRRRYKNARRP